MTRFQADQWEQFTETDFKAVPQHHGKTAYIVVKDPTMEDLELLKTYLGLWMSAKAWKPPAVEPEADSTEAEVAA